MTEHGIVTRKTFQMRKWLIILLVLSVAIIGTLWWLGSSLDKDRPADGEIRMEVEHVF
ncbi:MAG: hypothetical protein L3J02_08930 [Henriciella sp.]|nr:hypothetical protein [Henriciella sp.]